MKPQIEPDLVRCQRCGRFGWHPTERCPEPPAVTDTALMLDSAVNMIGLARADGNEVLRVLPKNAPLFAVVDLVAALGHLRQAAGLFDKAADQLEKAVQ